VAGASQRNCTRPWRGRRRDVEALAQWLTASDVGLAAPSSSPVMMQALVYALRTLYAGSMHAHLDLSDTRSPWIRVLRLPEKYDRVNERSTGLCRCQTNVPNGEPASVAGPRMIPNRVIQHILYVDLGLVCLPGSAPNPDRTQVGDCAPLTGLSVTRGGPPSVCRHYTWYLVLGPRLCFECH
jgi:hypothetical protein